MTPIPERILEEARRLCDERHPSEQMLAEAIAAAEQRGREMERGEMVPVWGWWYDGKYGGVTANEDSASVYSRNGFEVHQLRAIRSRSEGKKR